MYSSNPLVLRFDDVAKNGLRESLSSLVFSRRALFKPLPIESVAIIKKVFKLVHAPEYDFICFNSALKDRFTDPSEAAAKVFTEGLEFCLKEFPYYDAFSVVCSVFSLALQVQTKPNKHTAEDEAGIDVSRVKARFLQSTVPIPA